jgi:hypothetical protein
VTAVLGTLFGVEGRGAARIVSDQPLIFSHRVLNDRRAQSEGASLLNVASVSRSQALTAGYLAQQPS